MCIKSRDTVSLRIEDIAASDYIRGFDTPTYVYRIRRLVYKSSVKCIIHGISETPTLPIHPFPQKTILFQGRSNRI